MFKNKYWKMLRFENLLLIFLLFIILFGIGFFVYSIYRSLLFGTAEEKVAIYIILVAIVFITWIRKMVISSFEKHKIMNYRKNDAMKELLKEVDTVKKKIKFIDEFLVKYVKVDKEEN